MDKPSHTEVKKCPQCGYIDENILSQRCPRCCKSFHTSAGCCGSCSNCGTGHKTAPCDKCK